MDPSHVNVNELITLNPRLASRPESDLLDLLTTIKDCGYVWDRRDRCFVHAVTGVSIRTAGLDIFTPSAFRESHERHLRKVESGDADLIGLWQLWFPRLALLLLVDLLVGWFFLGLENWLVSLGAICGAFIVLHRISIAKLNRADL